MIDHILGRPSPALRRTEICFFLCFWIWRLYKGDGAPRPVTPSSSSTRTAFAAASSTRVGRSGQELRRRVRGSWIWRLWVSWFGRKLAGWMGKVNDKLQYFTPYQLILGTLTFVYALRHLDDLLGLGAPEPLARLYSRSYYRATYVNTAFDAGFASAMNIRPKWLKDIASMLFTGYYLLWATEGDEVLRKFRAVCSVEMLRVTWEKTKNPYVRLITTFHRPRLSTVRNVTIPRPPTSSRASLPPVSAMLFFHGSEAELAKATELVVDYPGGGFIAMGPECHEERLRSWAKRTGKPVLGVDYGKAPEYPYPWAIEEGFDAYRTLMETKGRCIGIGSGKLSIVLTGDSAGGNICATIMLRILEHPTGIPKPVSMILAYPCLDFNYTSWMSPTNLRVLRTEQSEVNIPGFIHGKDHMRHKSPLSVVDDVEIKRRRAISGRRREKSWTEKISDKLPIIMSPAEEKTKLSGGSRSSPATPASRVRSLPRTSPEGEDDKDGQASEPSESEDEEVNSEKKLDPRPEYERSLADRVKTPAEERKFVFTPVESPKEIERQLKEEVASKEESVDQIVAKKRKKLPIGTRLTMTSRVGYFQDRIISPSMMRAMAILYVGPRRNPDFETDYYISPILSPPHLLAHFPPVYLICGERDPFVDDTVIFAGKIREAKRARRAQAEYNSRGEAARHGEYLQMSIGKTKDKSASSSRTKLNDLPDPILRESDDDWVQMRIIEGWGHGFMQMSSLMREVDPVLADMADWIDESFARADERQRDLEEVAAAHAAAQASVEEDEKAALVSPTDHLMPSGSTHVKAARSYKKSPSHTTLGGADLGGTSYVGDSEDENDNLVTFTPKPKIKPKRSLPPSKFQPVPRRASKERLDLHRSESAPKFDIDETGSSGEAFCLKTPPLTARGLPGQGYHSQQPRGAGTFALFGGPASKRSASAGPSRPPGTPAYGAGSMGAGIYGSISGIRGGSRRGSKDGGVPSGGPGGSMTVPASVGSSTPVGGLGGGAASASGATPTPTQPDKPKNSLVAAAVAGARAASPALAAAGLVPQSVGNVSEAELMRRRRMEAVYGIGGADSQVVSEGEDE
ncbi:hormone-sensitive lipase [Kwoniella heveanensis BCC8398]|uniref:Hormone-sensitive lipase n=1 Tax=Kwoniella heveanensis BCC8398 TaxID=1296120 RepID=A0A1B9GWU2_9TREE|nr:hormone-sensitive lipase [Kwoniella heveanensis BCC8398]